MNVSVRNMKSDKSGREVTNQFIINTDEGCYFQSYQTVIVFIPNSGPIQLAANWDCSITTGKYRNQFLGEKKKETERKLKSGEYVIME